MTAFIVATVILLSALTVGIIVSRQLRLTLNIVASDRAFYAANSGLEEMLYAMSRRGEKMISATGEIEYQNVNGIINTAEYEGEGAIVVISGVDVQCIKSQGQFGNERRFVQIGPAAC